MTTEECYALLGADYADVLRRMGNEDRVKRFLLKFPGEPSYGLLCRSVEGGDAKEAFRAAHSIKGVCLNLGLTALYRSAGALSEELRGGAFTDSVPGLLRQVGEDYQKTINAIRELGQA
ncbi:Hpt domain-containing protein [uncultured Anaerotruncus sp.]|uniref:Hpt domain-containing protein n=1 Tax=uncultured Anaerotruncus sp. TaxID=905011 RepID=UPI00280A6B5E|nr:Hpt domain-containing protein [uncultured Anaerotruncus sp.]